jgi:hypothetical protein
VFSDDLTPPAPGYAKVRVIHTIPGAPTVTTQLTATTGGSNAPPVNLAPVGYKQASPHVPIVGGIYQVEVKAPNGAVVSEAHDWSAVAGTVISIVVVEATSGPTLEILSDAAGSSTAPVGAMQTGFGGYGSSDKPGTFRDGAGRHRSVASPRIGRIPVVPPEPWHRSALRSLSPTGSVDKASTVT